MTGSLVKAAAEAFSQGRYAEAKIIYKQLGETLGENLFRANLELCDRRLSAVKQGDRWLEISVGPGDVVAVTGSIAYPAGTSAGDRKAVLLLKAYDDSGSETSYPFDGTNFSRPLNSRFKYLAPTDGRVVELYRFSVPQGISRVRASARPFNVKPSENITLADLALTILPQSKAPHPFIRPSALASEVSILGWPDYPPTGKPCVIGVMDEFTTGCFEEDVTLIQPRPDNWYALAEKFKPDLIFIESAWKGNFGSWQYRVGDYANKPGEEVAHICQYAREQGIPTLFWNKEDPVHHDKFMCSAKLVDHIFTTDASMKDSYRAKTGNHNVHALPFAAQPALHKPAPLAGRKPRSCFAGSWYGDRHAERGQAIRWLLQSANRHGLDIYDRNYGTGAFPFPDEYQAGIKGSLPYKQLCEEYRRYRIFLNVNSVTDSPTMFSRRVFELMACGTPVVSTYAKGIENLFESDAVWMVRNQREADEAIEVLMTDDAEWRRRSLAGMREVFAKHTYAHRLNDIFAKLGITSRIPTDPPLLLVAIAKDHHELDTLNQCAKRQTYRHFRLGIECTHEVTAKTETLSSNITLFEPGTRVGWLTETLPDYAVAGWLSSQCHYGEHYLRDLANASLYEPHALGWAKAYKSDVFAYGESAPLCCALWRSEAFLHWADTAHHDAVVTRPDLYLVDSDQFEHAGLANNRLVRS